MRRESAFAARPKQRFDVGCKMESARSSQLACSVHSDRLQHPASSRLICFLDFHTAAALPATGLVSRPLLDCSDLAGCMCWTTSWFLDRRKVNPRSRSQGLRWICFGQANGGEQAPPCKGMMTHSDAIPGRLSPLDDIVPYRMHDAPRVKGRCEEYSGTAADGTNLQPNSIQNLPTSPLQTCSSLVFSARA